MMGRTAPPHPGIYRVPPRAYNSFFCTVALRRLTCCQLKVFPPSKRKGFIMVWVSGVFGGKRPFGHFRVPKTLTFKTRLISSAKPFLSKWIGQFRVPKTLTFKKRPSAQPFLWKWVLFAWEWKIISISKAEHFTSLWYRGPAELLKPIVFARFLNQFQINRFCLALKQRLGTTRKWPVPHGFAWRNKESEN